MSLGKCLCACGGEEWSEWRTNHDNLHANTVRKLQASLCWRAKSSSRVENRETGMTTTLFKGSPHHRGVKTHNRNTFTDGSGTTATAKRGEEEDSLAEDTPWHLRAVQGEGRDVLQVPHTVVGAAVLHGTHGTLAAIVEAHDTHH